MRTPVRHILLVLLGFITPVLWMMPLSADAKSAGSDTYSFEFRGEPLQQVLETIARATETDMMYDPKMIEDEVIFRRIREKPMPDLLSEVLTDTPFDYIVLSSGTTVIVRKVSDDPAYGSFAGKVRDSRTGQPLHGATVLLADVSGGTSTNRNGNFTLNRLMSGSYRIVISYVGYEPVEKVVEIEPDKHIETEVALDPRAFTFTPVVVRAHRPNLAGIGSRPSVSSLNNWEIAGGRRDAIRNLSLFPGLQYGLPMQDIHLQGGRQGEHRIRLDGIPVYNPYNFGHFYSAFSPVALGEVQLHKAGFGAGQGSMISGIIDFQHDLPSDGSNRAMFLGDPLNVNVRGDISRPTGSSSPMSVTGSVRSNFWDLYREPVMDRTLKDWDYVDPVLANHFLGHDNDFLEYRSLKQESDIRYFDGHFAFRYEPDPYNTIGASLYYGKNTIRSSHLGESTLESVQDNFLFTRDQYEWKNVVGQLSWETTPGPRTSLSTQLGLSTNRMKHHYRMESRNVPDLEQSTYLSADGLFVHMESGGTPGLPIHDGDNRIDHGLVQSELTYSISPEFRLDTGLEFNLVSSSVDFTEFFYLPASSEENSAFGSLYLNLNRNFGSYWQMTAGSRFTRTDNHPDVFIEPRYSLQYERIDSRIGYWSGRLSGGIYRQFIHQYEITNVGPTSMVPSFTIWSHASISEPPRAYHISGSWITKPEEHTSLKLEAYYKWEPTSYMGSAQRLATGDAYDRQSAEAFSESTRLNARGASIRLHRQFNDPQLKLMLGYDYSRSELEMSQFGRTLPASWNEPHRIQARSIMQLFGPVSLIANWKSIYGRTWGFRQAYYDYLYVKGERRIGDYSFATPEKDRMSPFHQLDLSLLYRPSLGFAEIDFRIDLINVLNRRNTIDWSLKPVGREDDSQPPMPEQVIIKEHYIPAALESKTPNLLKKNGDLHLTNTSPNSDSESEQGAMQYEIRKRTMPGFYPTFRIEVKF